MHQQPVHSMMTMFICETGCVGFPEVTDLPAAALHFLHPSKHAACVDCSHALLRCIADERHTLTSSMSTARTA